MLTCQQIPNSGHVPPSLDRAVSLIPEPIKLVGRRLVCCWPTPVPLIEAQRQLYLFARRQAVRRR